MEQIGIGIVSAIGMLFLISLGSEDGINGKKSPDKAQTALVISVLFGLGMALIFT